jgi:small-conductance mechanosensitive channel
VAEGGATPPSLHAAIHTLFVIAAALQGAIWGRELAIGYVEYRVGPESEHSTLGSAVGIIRLLVSVALFTIAVIVILDNLGVDVTGLVAGLGIGGIAIGLAAKGIFDDLFSALSIIFDKPFRRGETVNWEQTTGTVEEIGLKSTRVRAISGEEVVISNTNLLGKELRNYARLNHRRINQPFGIVYQSDPAICARIPAIMREIVEAGDKCEFVRCGMVAFGASSLDYELQYDVMSDDWQFVFDTRHAVLVAILERFNRDGIEFAYPTTTNFSAGPDGKMVLPYPPGLEAALVNAEGTAPDRD